MDPLSLAIGVGGPLLGGIFGGSMAASGASAQRAWEERMMNTQYQRAVQDMKLAGLNPMMMYAGKGGPTGSIPTPPNIGAEMAGPMAQGIASAAKSFAVDVPMAQSTMAKQAADAAQSKSAALVNTASVDKIRAETGAVAAQMALAQGQLENLLHTRDLTDAQKDEVRQQILELKARQHLEEQNAKVSAASARKAAQEANAVEVVAPAVSSATRGFQDMINWIKHYDDDQSVMMNEDIRPESYRRRVDSARSQGGTGAGGANSAKAASSWLSRLLPSPASRRNRLIP